MTDQPTAGVALKPCPFCGSVRAHTIYVRDGRQAGCPDCGARSGAAFHGRADQPSADERASTAWNTRTPASGAVEACETCDRLKVMGCRCDYAATQPLQGGGVTREAVKKIVMIAVARARRSETDPLRSYNVEWRISERDAAVSEAVSDLLALISPAQREGEG
ncbi:Lar family restriction alleviation protein [Brevundimonas sp. FT23028]|uniref:Lar family restriction alleviation protein n=1 Tax=Brevundimonas sp. FT23028 TaxID=3393748 RepID=UPI003B58848B